jgi:hypothetical protein
MNRGLPDYSAGLQSMAEKTDNILISFSDNEKFKNPNEISILGNLCQSNEGI